jgi:HEAT repeat protein
VAFGALKKISVRSVPDLIALLSDRDLLVKAFAAKRLGSMGSAAREAIPALNELLSRSGEREETRRVVREALQRIERGS